MAAKEIILKLGNNAKNKPIRFSYAHVFQPHAFDDKPDDKRYRVVILIPKDNKKDIDAIEDAIDEAVELGIETKSKWGKKRPRNLRLPLIDGEEWSGNEDGEYDDYMVLQPSNTRKPFVVNEFNEPITEESNEFYSGCWGYVSLNVYPYDTNSNGVGVSLRGVVKTKDGEPFMSIATSDGDFKDELSASRKKSRRSRDDEDEDETPKARKGKKNRDLY